MLLARILLRHHWGLSPKLISATPGYRKRIRVPKSEASSSATRPSRRASDFRFTTTSVRPGTDDGAPVRLRGLALGHTALPKPSSVDSTAAQAEGVDRRLELAIRHQFEVPGYNLVDYFLNQIHYLVDETARERAGAVPSVGARVVGA